MERAEKPQSGLMRDSDDRYLPRWEVENKVLYQIDDDIGIREAATKDLNCAGTCLRTQNEFHTDQKVKLTIYLDDNTPVTIHGQIRWIKDSDHKHPQEKEVGISFFNTPETVQNLILQYAFELNEKKLANYWFKDWNGSAK
ncbi:MAG: PilZ domain-containing protein [Candidatus Omnitrophica bacterium]|nr:PilZ domain-containing protein [Candidatus Omnitrophota bacterium]